MDKVTRCISLMKLHKTDDPSLIPGPHVEVEGEN